MSLLDFIDIHVQFYLLVSIDNPANDEGDDNFIPHVYSVLKFWYTSTSYSKSSYLPI